MKPEFLAIGYLTCDRVAGRTQAGGSCYYGAHTARRLGLKPHIFTSATREFVVQDHFEGIDVATTPSTSTTTFEHTYDPITGVRSHRCTALASSLDPALLPTGWKQSRLVVVCPNGAEVGPESVNWCEAELTALLPQGWFRQFHPDGRVTFQTPKWNSLPRKVDLIVVSVDDIAGDPASWEWIKRFGQVAVKTLGRKGHIVAWDGKEQHFAPPHVSNDIDPTGAGDVFSVAMLIALSHGADPVHASNFGSVAASFAVEQPGIAGIPTRKAIQERLAATEQRLNDVLRI